MRRIPPRGSAAPLPFRSGRHVSNDESALYGNLLPRSAEIRVVASDLGHLSRSGFQKNRFINGFVAEGTGQRELLYHHA